MYMLCCRASIDRLDETAGSPILGGLDLQLIRGGHDGKIEPVAAAVHFWQ